MALTTSRRQFLTLPVLGLLPLRAAIGRAEEQSVRSYEANVGVLFDLFTFSLKGNVTAEIDRPGARYRVTMAGEGPGVTTGTEARGVIREGRFMPTETRGYYVLRGRESWVFLRYDYDRRLIEYHSVSYTLFLGRRRQVEDVVRLAPGQQVDDVITAELNFAAGLLETDPEGAQLITVVRRARPANEGPDDVSPDGYRAELVTLRFRPAPEAGTGRLTALVDLTGFSSWARAGRPARVAFSATRRVEHVTSSLILGTSFTLRLTSSS